MAPQPFRFRRFRVEQDDSVYPISTDSVLLGAWADTTNALKALDIGTGTGVIALMIAQRTNAETQILGVDSHPDACSCAQRNFQASPWANRLISSEIPVQQLAVKMPERFDLIVSNPPFFTETIVSPDIQRRNSRSAVTLPLPELLDAVNALLSRSGKFCTILPVLPGRQFAEWSACQGLYCTSETIVYTRPGKPAERLLLQFERNPVQFRRSTLLIFEQDGTYSPAFRQLTEAFYLKSNSKDPVEG